MTDKERRERAERRLAALGFAAPLVILFTLMIALSVFGHEVRSNLDPHDRSVARATTLPQPDSWLQDLRDQAAIGNRAASVQLAASLLERYERDGDREELYEALHWVDRHWDSAEYRESGLLSRVFDKDCDGRVARWHWICNAAE